MTKVFVYGTLKKGWGNHRLLEGSTFLGVYETPKEFSLYDGGFPYAFHGGGENIRGELYEVDDDTLKNLDRLEGYPSHYNRIKIEAHDTADSMGENYEAWIYVGTARTFEHVNKSHSIIGKTIWPNGHSFVEWNHA